MEELYNKLLFVSLRSSSREERRVRLRIAVAVCSQQSRGKELYVRLTDDEDPFFLFTLQLAEDDFQRRSNDHVHIVNINCARRMLATDGEQPTDSLLTVGNKQMSEEGDRLRTKNYNEKQKNFTCSLKNQQGLLVDFGAFPQNFIDLLRLCLEEESKDLPKFLLTFTISEHDCGISHLNVVETNSFKHLTHLSLKFLLGNDVDVKKYLAGCLTSLKEENRSLKQKLQTTESELSSRLVRSQEALAARNKELSTLREEFASKSSSLLSKHSQDLTAEREKSLQIQSSCQKRFDQEKKELESSHKAVVHELQSKLSKLSIINGELNEGKFRSESSTRDLKNKISLLEEECQRSKVELTKLRRDNASLDVERHERDKTLNHLRTRIAVLEQEVKDNQEVITRTKELLDVANDQKRKCDETLAERQQQLNKSEKTVKSISEELIKGNEIILRLQKELRNAKAKNKLNSTVIAQQEKVISEKDTTLEKQSKELTILRADVKTKETEIKTLTESLEAATEKLEESKQLLKTNENVINWLNKQMNEQCVQQTQFGRAAVHSTGPTIGFRSAFQPHSTPLSTDSGTHSGHTYFPRYTSQAQVVYRPGHKLDHRTPTVAEEKLKISPQSGSTSVAKSAGKENNPLIDPKYLTQTSQKSNQQQKAPLQVQNRKDNPANGPLSSRPPPTVPLMSAYFPNDASSVAKNGSSLL